MSDASEDTVKGNRPSFTGAAALARAEPLYEQFCSELGRLGVPVARGVFAARMLVEIENDGSVTIVLDAWYAAAGRRAPAAILFRDTFPHRLEKWARCAHFFRGDTRERRPHEGTGAPTGARR